MSLKEIKFIKSGFSTYADNTATKLEVGACRE